jgi:aminopeptidase N
MLVTALRPSSALIFLLLTLPAHAQKIDVYSRPLQEERSRNYDVQHYRIELRFEEETKSLWGEVTIQLSSLWNGLSTCIFDAETFTVEKVEDESSRSLDFEHRDGKLEVHLAEPLDYGQAVSIVVTYSAKDMDVDASRYGQSSDYDLGLNFKPETPDNPQLISTLSWPEGARHWFPCYDHPNDRATQELIATVRKEYKVLSNGRLLSVTDGPESDTHTWHWFQKLSHPTYLFVLAAGPYVVLEDSLKELSIRYWVYEKDKDDAMRSFVKTPEIIEFFNKEYGYEYPWAKYDQVTIPNYGGGAESTSATVLGQSTIHNERAEQDFPSHGLVAHEAAHQWWGNLVSYRAWSETWISESFATYGEYLFSKHDLGEDEGAVNLLEKKNAYLHEARTRYMRPVVFHRWNYPNDNFDSHTYPKGAVILNMLRWILGDEPFRKALSHFLHEHAFQAVDTHDLMKAIKEATGQNMDGFFDQWIFRPGHPVFEISYDWNRAGKKLALRIRQTQDTSGDVPIYTTPVDIGVHTATGKGSHRLRIDEKEELFELDLNEEPLLVRFDEGNYLLKEWSFKKSAEELLYQLQNDDVIGKIWAASELGEQSSDPRTLDALRETARSDPFWSVRRAAVAALGALEEEGSSTAFFKEMALDESSRVRVEALKALGEMRRRQLSPFFKERFQADDSYLAQAEALLSIGKTGDQEAIAFLESASAMSSPRDVLRRAAELALIYIKRGQGIR